MGEKGGWVGFEDYFLFFIKIFWCLSFLEGRKFYVYFIY